MRCVPRSILSALSFSFSAFCTSLGFAMPRLKTERRDGSHRDHPRLAWLQGAMRRPAHFSNDVSDTPSTISTITGTKVLSIANTLAYLVIMKPRPEIVV